VLKVDINGKRRWNSCGVQESCRESIVHVCMEVEVMLVVLDMGYKGVSQTLEKLDNIYFLVD